MNKKVCVEIQRTLGSASGLRLPWFVEGSPDSFSPVFFSHFLKLSHIWRVTFFKRKKNLLGEGQVLSASSVTQGKAWKIEATC